jgi:hypothetical protein
MKCEVLTHAVTNPRSTARRKALKLPDDPPCVFLGVLFFTGGLERVVLLLRAPEARVDVREAMR